MSFDQITFFDNVEDKRFLTEQIITYIGNKRSLLSFINVAVSFVKNELGKEKIDIVDMFSGSGVVARFFKKDAYNLFVNDLEDYCKTINECYLTNVSDFCYDEYKRHYEKLKEYLKNNVLKSGFISELYAPKNDLDIQKGERVFFTKRNANYIDTVREYINTLPKDIQKYFLAPLIYETSVHNNTSGVFKGFYKNSKTGIGQFGGDGQNALQRIKGDIELKEPIFSRFNCNVHIYQEDCIDLVKKLPEVDLTYMDPPYNQHPYGSNYFMLNLVNNYKKPIQISEVSGIPVGWNKSLFNKKQTAKETMYELCKNLKSKYLLISFNSDGFITRNEMVSMLSEIGHVDVYDKEYNTFRGSRNLNDRDIYVKEFLYLVRK